MVAAGGLLGMGAEDSKGRIEDGEVRVFRVSVDVRSFRAGSRLPARAVNAFVRVVLPQSIVKLAMTSPYPANAAKLTAPLRTHPPVLIAKGTEIVIPNGYVALELPASIASLSTALAEEPHILAQVLHSDRYMADSVIGSASIPMAPLLNESRLDGYAPVFSPSEGDREGLEDQVNIGALRVVLAVDELGPVMGAARRHHRHVDPANLQLSNQQVDNMLHRHVDPGSNTEKQKSGKEREAVEEVLKSAGHNRDYEQECFGKQARSVETMPDGGVDHGCVAPQSEMDPRKTLEYEMAWEFEIWRRSEEVKWRADLKDREMSRMLALEDEWRRREKELSMEAEKSRKEQDALEAKLKTKLFEIEKMERKLVQAQEAASHRKEALDKEYASRLTDAQVAVKRHQTECEHRVDLEQGKYTALLEQHAVLEKRLATANKSLTALEKQFFDYKAAQRNTVEADLAAQVLVVKQQCSDYKARFEAAARSKGEYKAQVLRMAKEMAGLYCGRHDTSRGNGQFGGKVIAGSTSDDDKNELQEVRRRVHNVPQGQGQVAMSLRSAHASAPWFPRFPAANLGNTEVRPHLSDSRTVVGIGDAAKSASKPMFAQPATKPIFAQPLTDRTKLETTPEQALDESALTCNAERKSGELRKPLLEVGQKMEEPRAPVVVLEKARIRQQSDVENELIEGAPDTAFMENEIRRLRRQRSELLNTGIYSVSDKVIRGLDVEIRRLGSG